MPFENNFVYKIYSFTLARKTTSFPVVGKQLGEFSTVKGVCPQCWDLSWRRYLGETIPPELIDNHFLQDFMQCALEPALYCPAWETPRTFLHQQGSGKPSYKMCVASKLSFIYVLAMKCCNRNTKGYSLHLDVMMHVPSFWCHCG